MKSEKSAGKAEAEMQWMDQQTADWIEWSFFTEQIKPLSILGRKRKAELRPFTAGEEEHWEREIHLTKQLALIWQQKDLRDQLQELFLKVTDPSLLLALMQRGESGEEDDWFTLKQFLWNGQAVFQLLANVGIQLNRKHTGLTPLLHWLGTDELSFSLEDTSPSVQEARQELRKHQQAYTQKVQKVKKKIEEELHITFVDQHYIYVDKKDQQKVANCQQHTALELVQKTPYEHVFRLKNTVSQVLLQGIEQAEHRCTEVELAQLHSLAEQFRPYIEDIRSYVEAIAQWDWRWAKYKWYQQLKSAGGACWPTLTNQGFQIEQGVFLPLKKILLQQNRSYFPTDIACPFGLSTIVGTNMGGKSIVLKMSASLLALAHYALPVPAQECHLTLFQRLTVISGDQQSVSEGLSTFGAEMKRLADVINEKNHVLLLDELARGTNPQEGEALAWSIGQHLAQQHTTVTLMVTHFPQVLTVEKGQHYRVKGMRQDGSIDYTLELGAEHDVPRQAIRIAEELGLPVSLIQHAKKRIAEKE